MKKLRKDIEDLKQCLEFRENILEEKVTRFDEKHVNLDSHYKYYYNKLVELHDRSGRKT